MNRSSTLQKRDLKPAEQLCLQPVCAHSPLLMLQLRNHRSCLLSASAGLHARLGWLSHTAGRVIMGDSLVTPLINHTPAWYRSCLNAQKTVNEPSLYLVLFFFLTEKILLCLKPHFGAIWAQILAWAGSTQSSGGAGGWLCATCSRMAEPCSACGQL